MGLGIQEGWTGATARDTRGVAQEASRSNAGFRPSSAAGGPPRAGGKFFGPTTRVGLVWPTRTGSSS